jgi:hypothetical protein
MRLMRSKRFRYNPGRATEGVLPKASQLKVTLMLLRTLLFLALVGGVCGVAQAQRRPIPPPILPDQDMGRHDSDRIGGDDPRAEMLARQYLKAVEKDYQENIERAREAAQLSTEIRAAFLSNKTFGRTEQKKLERLEKIARKIRSHVGGSDDDVTLENVPSQLEPALARLAEISDKVREGVEKTPRQVVSAAVIESANELLEITRHIRGFTR